MGLAWGSGTQAAKNIIRSGTLTRGELEGGSTMSKSRLIIVVALSLMTLQAWAADKSLVLYLPFDEGAGTTAKDVSTYNNPGTVVGAAAWVPGPKGTALEFVSMARASRSRRSPSTT